MTSTNAAAAPTGVEWTPAGPRPVADLEATFTHGTTDGIVEVRYEYRPELIDFGTPAAEGATGMWRYAGLLPPFPGPVTYPLRVGGTALLRSAVLARRAGIPNLMIKDETQGPSLSNKDRSTAVVVEYARQTGAAAVAAASTGNVAASLAVGAAAVGLPAVIFVPARVDPGKLMFSATTGATIVLVERGYRAAFALSRQLARRFGWLDRNTGVNPLTIEGKKTVAFEIWEQNGRRFPDTVVAPIGDGVTLYALAKGFAELAACGALGREPRIIGVQSSGCAPVASAWRDGGRIEPVQPDTIADGIAVGAPVCGPLVLDVVRRTGGQIIAVDDSAILGAVHELGGAGLLAEPSGACAYAGLRAAVAEGVVDRDEQVVALMTGSLVKVPQFAAPPQTAVTVSGDPEEAAETLGRILRRRAGA